MDGRSGKFRSMTLERFRAGSQIEWNIRPSTRSSLPTNASSRVLFTIEQMNDWNRESAFAISMRLPPPKSPIGSMPSAYGTSTGAYTGKHPMTLPPVRSRHSRTVGNSRSSMTSR